MKLNKTLALAVSAALTMGISSNASASVYAGSRLLINDLKVVVTNSDGSPALPAVNTNTGFTFTTGATATLNGSSAPGADSISCVGQPGCTHVPPAPVLSIIKNAPGGNVTRSDSSTFLGPIHGTQTYSNSAAEILTAQLVDGVPTKANQISEVEIENSGSGDATTNITSNTQFVFNFTLGGTGGNVKISFQADPNMFVDFNTPLAVPPIFATATTSASVTLVGNGVDVNWASTGNTLQTGNPLIDQQFNFAKCTGGVACTEVVDGWTVDPLDGVTLNNSITLPAGNPASNGYSDGRFGTDEGFRNYELLLSGLNSGAYTLTLNGKTSAEARQQVPEPSLLALLGMSLAGMGFARRKKIAG